MQMWWLPLDGAKFMARTAPMNTKQVGIYALFTAHLVLNARLPASMAALRCLSKGAAATDVNFVLRYGKFERDEAGWFSGELNELKTKAIDIHFKRAEAGRRGAEKRWSKKNDK